MPDACLEVERGPSMATQTMLAAVFYGGRDIRVEERPIPEPLRDELLVRVRSAGICGSDLLGYNEIGPWQRLKDVGIEDGHELAGEITAIGDHVRGFVPGDRVAIQPEHLIACGSCHECEMGCPHLCRHLGMLHGSPHNSHGFSQYDTVLASHVRQISQSLSFDAAAITDCYAVAVHAVHRVGGVRDQMVAIIGCGTIGLCVGQTARALGAAHVVMIGNRANALGIALSSQAANDVIFVPTDDPATILSRLTGGVGPTVVFEAVGRSGSTLEEALELVAPAGQVCIVGAFTSPPMVPPQVAYEKEASLLWSNSYGLYRGNSEFEQTLELMSGGRVHPEDLITDRFPLGQIAEAFTTANDKAASQAIKVVVNP